MDDESSPSNGAANFASSDHGAYAKYAHWDLSFDAGGKGGEAAKEQKELILECKGHCQQLLTLVSTDLLKFEHKQGPVDMSRFPPPPPSVPMPRRVAPVESRVWSLWMQPSMAAPGVDSGSETQTPPPGRGLRVCCGAWQR